MKCLKELQRKPFSGLSRVTFPTRQSTDLASLALME